MQDRYLRLTNSSANMPALLQAHFIFSLRKMPTQEKIKRACKPTHGDSAIVRCKLDMTALRTERRATDNSTFAIGGVSCSADSLVVAESFVLRINISGKNPAHRKSAKR
jgi:hypothetical protein